MAFCVDVWKDDKRMAMRDIESGMPQGRWNLFGLYINVITRVNLTVEFVPDTNQIALIKRDSRLKKLHIARDSQKLSSVYLSLARDCVWFDRSSPAIRSVASTESSDSPRGGICLCPGHHETSKNPQVPLDTADSSLKPNRSAKKAKVAAGEMQEYYWRRKLSLFSLNEEFDSRESTPLRNGFGYSHIHLILFFFFVSSSTFLVAKQIFYSSLWAEQRLLEDSRSTTVTQSPASQSLSATPFEQKPIYPRHDSTATTYWSQMGVSVMVKRMIHHYLLGDIFIKFSNTRMFNLIAMTLLIPSAIIRLERLLRLFRSFKQYSTLSHPPCSRDTQPINTVQLNLSYLYSLKTVTHLWMRLVLKSWYHKHRYSDLWEDLKQVFGNVLSNNVKSLNLLDLRTKLYLYNMIQFDYCYADYFMSNHSKHILKHDSNDVSTKMADVKPHGHRKNIFIAKPIHRIDMHHMAWLLLMLLVLYVASLLSILSATLCSIAIELNIQNFEQLTFANILLGWNKVKAELAWLRLVQLFVWQIFIILAIFDLFNFYSCCIICFSRVSYIKRRLEQILESCRLIDEISWVKIPAGHRAARKMPRDVGYRTPTESQSHLQQVSVSQLPHINRNHYQVNQATASSSKNLSNYSRQIRSINNQLRVTIDWILLVQQELIDVNKFFTNYLILEIIFKVLCLTYVIGTFISFGGQLFENCFLLVNGNTAFTPIMIVVVMASLIEHEFRGVCRELDRIMIYGHKFLTLNNRRQLVIQANYLSIKNNRSFVLGGYFAITLGSLLPVVGWIASGIVLMYRKK